jgi:MFS family permease
MQQSESRGRTALQHPDYRNYLVLRVAARASIEMLVTGVSWHVYEMTGDPFSLGIVGLVQFLPFLFLFLVSGEVADRVPRILILRVTLAVQMACAAVFLGLTASGNASFGSFVVILVVLGIDRAFQSPAAQAVLPLLVPPEHFANAVAWNSMGFGAARIVGPAVAGGLLVAGESVVYGTSMVLLAVSSLLTFFVHPARQDSGGGRITMDTVLAGFRFIWSRQIILGAITLDLFAVLLGGATALLPIFAADILGVGEVGFGALRTALVIGSLLASIFLAQRPIHRHAGRKLLVSVAIFGLAICLFGFSEWFWLSFLALLVMGAADGVSMYVRANLVQMVTPDAMRGRVSAVEAIFIGASNQVGEFESGVTAAWWGVVPAVLVGGIGTLVVAAASLAVFPRLARVDSLDPDDLVRRYRDEDVEETGTPGAAP